MFRPTPASPAPRPLPPVDHLCDEASDTTERQRISDTAVAIIRTTRSCFTEDVSVLDATINELLEAQRREVIAAKLRR